MSQLQSSASVESDCAEKRAGETSGCVGTVAAPRAMFGLIALFAAADSNAAVPPLPAAPSTHRSLRDNAPVEMPAATAPSAFTGYPGAPPFVVVPQKDKLTWFPCTNCHAALHPDPTPRKLLSPHPAALSHGDGRIWCLDCHQLNDRDHLHTLAGQAVDFDAAYLVCGQCHFNRQKDWYFGAHGKRVGNWRGRRLIYNCTHCHDPHSPNLKPRAPERPPPVRAGLKPMPQWSAAAASDPKTHNGGPTP
jgi:hypothetical protein